MENMGRPALNLDIGEKTAGIASMDILVWIRPSLLARAGHCCQAVNTRQYLSFVLLLGNLLFY